VETPYDWVTVIVFAGLIVLFLQRSQGVARDHLWQYLIAALGCAGTNYLGNIGWNDGLTAYHAGAIALGLATVGFVWFVLQPFDNSEG
jgi:hypothetical protein